MSVLDAGGVATEQTRSLFDIALAQIFGLTEFLDFLADEHKQPYTDASLIANEVRYCVALFCLEGSNKQSL